jgi:hypothetical protein
MYCIHLGSARRKARKKETDRQIDAKRKQADRNRNVNKELKE